MSKFVELLQPRQMNSQKCEGHFGEPSTSGGIGENGCFAVAIPSDE